MQEQVEFLDFFSVDSGRLPLPQEMSSLALAYIGDAVWEMVVRRHLLVSGEFRPNRLHKTATQYVKAGTQAELAHMLDSVLTEEEKQIYRRGRNAKSGHVPKNADIVEYRQSSGFEAIFGYLYITKQYDRLQELGTLCITEVERMLSK